MNLQEFIYSTYGYPNPPVGDPWYPFQPYSERQSLDKISRELESIKLYLQSGHHNITITGGRLQVGP